MRFSCIFCTFIFSPQIFRKAYFNDIHFCPLHTFIRSSRFHISLTFYNMYTAADIPQKNQNCLRWTHQLWKILGGKKVDIQ